MALYSFKDATFTIDSTAGTTVEVTQSILEIDVPNVEGVLEESHTMGDQWREYLFAGLRQAGELAVTGFYDDAASTGFDAIFNDPGNTKTLNSTTRTVQIKIGGTKTMTFEAWIKTYERMMARGTLTKAKATLSVTGAVTEV